jgi:ABC-2 type transport system ATP-binding protein
VGILSEGRLVDEGTLEQLRHLSAHTVEVTFDGKPPGLDSLPGVRAASAGENAVRYEVSGSVGPLIKRLADYPVVSLTSREPSLEEIFLHHYDSGAGGGGD